MKKIYLLFFLFCMSLFAVGQTDATLLKESNLLKSGSLKLSKIPIVGNSIIVLDNEVIYNYSGKIDTFTVPSNVSKIKITVIGAAGSTDANSPFPGGLGALVSGEFDVTPGDSLKLLVGEKPSRNGGGGGSFVSDLSNNPLIIAGGGGGSGVMDSPEKHGSITETGGKGGGSGGDGGTNGNGGLANGTSYQSGAGGGFYTNGANGDSPMTGGTAFVNGGNHLSVGWGDGGFGGGGTGSGYVVGGGGGGYSGGGAAGYDTGGGVGGGGASFNSGLNKNFIAQNNSGHGQIIIELLAANPCPEDIVVDNDSASCGAVVDYTVTAPEKGSVLQTAGLPTGSEFPVGTTTNCFRLIDSLDVETTCCFTVTVNDTEAPVAVCKEAGGTGKAAYVTSNVGFTWWRSDGINESLMDSVFGNGNWDRFYFETVDAGALLSSNYDFIYMDGGNEMADEMETFVDANISAMETWVANGGNLFLNSAPNEGDGMDWGFWGVKLQYNSGPYSLTVEATDPLHPIFTGPFTPVIAGPYNGNEYALAIIPEELNVNVLMHNIADTTMHVLSSIEWGTGKVFFGGMTPTNWHLTMPEALNLKANMLHYLGTKTKLEFQLDNTGIATITPEDIDGGSFDNCGSIDSMEIDRNTFTIDDLGEQEVTLTVFDAAGNSSTCTSTITISSSDKEEPQVVANPMTVYLDETGNYKFNLQDLEVMAAGTTDNKTPFDELKLVAYPKMFNCAQIGEIIHVRLTVEDEDGNNARKWTTVTVLDTIAPMAVCRNIEVYLDENGQAVITPEQVNDTTSFDACGIESITLDRDTLSCIDLGETSVTLIVTDLSGNVGTCTAMVMVHDTLPPLPLAVADVEIEVEPGVCETLVEYPVDVVTDNCGTVLEQTAGLGPDGLFPLGTTTETWIATDDAGNTAEITFNVIVTTTNALPTLDTVINVIADEDTSPVTVDLSGISYGIDCAEQEVTVSAIADNTDLVTAVTVEYVDGEPTGSVMITLAPDKNGTSDITVTVEDSEGGSITQSFTLTVNPVNDSPVVVYPIADQVINASYVLKLPISSDLGNLFQDPDGDELSVSVMLDNGDPLPAWAQIVGDTLVFSPMIADTGCIQIVVKAIDPSGMFANNPFKLCIDGYPVSSPRLNESAFDVKMYPNPTNGRVNIEINNAAGISDVAVFSITGKEVLRKNFYNNKIISFNMNDYASGMYLVKMNVEGNQIVKKLVLDKK
jgi:hypothetical protein